MKKILKFAIFFITMWCLYAPQFANATQKIDDIQQLPPVKGHISDVSGQPVIGVSIFIKGTSQGTITNVEGNFTLNASDGGTLVISCVGYASQELIFSPGQVFNIILRDEDVSLNEVVVVGYGVQKKSDITGAVAAVDMDRLEKIPAANALQAVQGATSGLNITQTSPIPGTQPSALIRGQNSINASSTPYIVVDGVPISKSGGSLNDINPNDIESIEILKDASATAIYGTNGANGVILVTTKHGLEGKPKVHYSGYAGVESFSKKLEFCNGEQITQRYRDYVAQNPGETMYNDFVKNQEEAINQQNGVETDWIYDMVSQTGVIQNHNIAISGGTEDVKYFISGDYLKHKGVLKGYNYQRFSLRMNLDADVTKYLKIGTNSYIVSHNKDGGRVNLMMAEAMSPYGKVYEDDGSYCTYPMASEKLFFNPMIKENEDHERRSWNINLNSFAEVDFGRIIPAFNGLKYKLNTGYNYIPEREAYFDGVEQNNLNGGYAYYYNAETQGYTIENIFSFIKEFEGHHIDVTALLASGGRKYHNSQASGEKFIDEQLLWHNLSTAQTQTAGSYSDKYNSVSQMGRINYSYASKYLLTITMRRDGSSVFGADNKFGFFPSVAIGWNITNEKFLNGAAAWLNLLKFRVSYGKSGNEAISVYRTISKMDNALTAMDGTSVAAIWAQKEMGNSELSWETTRTFNFGTDFGLFNNRITGTLDIYSSHTTGLLLNRNLPKVSGYNNIMTNMGETQNKGVELSIETRNLKPGNFQWQTILVFSYNKNEILDLYGDNADDIGNRWFIGQPIGVIYDYEMEGIWQEDEIARGEHLKQDPEAQAGDIKLKDINGDNKITPEEDKTIQGQTSPKWTAGLTNIFSYKNLSLSIFISTVQGIKKNNMLLETASDEMGRRNTTTEIGYWTKENQSNEFRSLAKTSNRWGYNFPSDASFTRIKDVTLSYKFSENAIKKLKIEALTMYLTGTNLFTFTKWKGWDPEVNMDLRGNGNYETNYPMTKTVVFGLNVTF